MLASPDPRSNSEAGSGTGLISRPILVLRAFSTASKVDAVIEKDPAPRINEQSADVPIPRQFTCSIPVATTAVAAVSGSIPVLLKPSVDTSITCRSDAIPLVRSAVAAVLIAVPMAVAPPSCDIPEMALVNRVRSARLEITVVVKTDDTLLENCHTPTATLPFVGKTSLMALT